MKMTRFQTFWIQMRKNKPLDESCKTGQTSGTKMAFYSKFLTYRAMSFQKINHFRTQARRVLWSFPRSNRKNLT
ncbi:hypothetical protein Hanom_Chr03g00241751 [Helianthus anomalus]